MEQGIVAPEATGAVAPAVEAPEVSATPETQEANRPRVELPDSVKQRMASLSRNESKFRRESAEQKARADHFERLYTQAQTPQSQPQQRSEPQVDQEELMSRATKVAEFNLRCNDIAAKGKSTPGFDTALSNLGMIGMSEDALSVLIEADDAPKVIAHLGQHLDEAAELFAKSPAQMARALAKLEAKLDAAPAVSAAPDPIKPVRTSSPPSDPKPGEPGWAQWRNKQRMEKFGRP